MSRQPAASERAVAQRFRELRLAAGWSQAETAARMTSAGWPWHQSTVVRIEGGSQILRIGELLDLASIFGVPAARLLTGDGGALADERREMERILREQIAAEIASGTEAA
jgi:transcriptional regulator with XRE-family HTH domain